MRLVNPQVRIFGSFVKVSWFYAFKVFIFFVDSFVSSDFFVFVGFFFDLEASFSLKLFLNSIGCSNFFFERGLFYFSDFRYFFLLNISIITLEDLSFCFFLYMDLRLESPLLFSRLRKSFFLQADNFFVCAVGFFSDYFTFPIVYLGNSILSFFFFIIGKSFFFNFFSFKDFFSFKLVGYTFSEYSSFNFFIGSFILYRRDFFFFFYSIYFFFLKNVFFFRNQEFFFINVVSDSLGFISFNEVGLVPTINSSFFYKRIFQHSFFYLLGISSLNFKFKKSILIYQGSFEVSWSKQIYMYFPVSIYVEKFSFYFNLEGRLRKGSQALSNFSIDVFSDFDIFRSIFYFKNFFINSNFSFIDSFYFLSFFFSFFIDYSCLYFFNLNNYISNISFNYSNYFFPVFFDYKKYACFNSLFNFKPLYWNIYIQNSKVLQVNYGLYKNLTFYNQII